MLKTINLHGELADLFGDYFKLDVDTPAEATHAIACQIPAFKKYMLEAEQNSMRFAVFLDEEKPENNIGENEIGNQTSANIIHIVPRIMGAGGDSFGFLQVITGAVLVGLSFTPFGAPFAPALLGAGAGLMVGGVASLFMPTPELVSQDEDGNRANYGFGSAVTTTAQGNPVPWQGGERLIGGFLISAGIFTEDTQ